MRGLTGKNVIVTGAASGIGRATAARLLEEGASVMGSDLTSGADAPAVPTGPGAWAFTTVDVTDEASVVHLVEEAARTFGRIDGLVNAAGVAGGGAVHMVDSAEWNRVVGVNLYGTFLTAKHAITKMLDQPLVEGARGSVVTIASIEGIEGTAGGSATARPKGASSSSPRTWPSTTRDAGSVSTRCAPASSTRP
jgi:NAD(P)-dependent dehydrogenase (short-subunit alcohol dehydrogenase family)